MFPDEMLTMLEYPVILDKMAEYARTNEATLRILALRPQSDPNETARLTAQTASARKIYDAMGAPPVHSMSNMDQISGKFRLGETLLIPELNALSEFLRHCRLLRNYMERAYPIDPAVAAYGLSIEPLSELREEIERCIRHDEIEDRASQKLNGIRQKRANNAARIKEKLSSLLRARPEWFQEAYHSQRGGRYVLPVKREYRAQVKGSVLDASASGATVFIEPQSVSVLQRESELLGIDESNEIVRILAELSAMAAAHAQTISVNRQAMIDIDYAFACARLGHEMNGVCARPTAKRALTLIDARHPLLEGNPVPLTLSLGSVRGLVITGPNTGGKTVALKTVGLLSLMALSGLQVPAREAEIPAFRGIYCDIGDGQSITQNLSTFSSHVTRVVRILEQADGKSLVLLDELGGGTDPQEGMGFATAVLEEMGRRGCLLVGTSHYPEIKAFAEKTPGFQNARMLFDRVNLRPLFKLEAGCAGESCALYIARRLGVPDHLLTRAWQIAYPGGEAPDLSAWTEPEPVSQETDAEIAEDMPMPEVRDTAKAEPKRERFEIGDAVVVPFMHQRGIICRPRNAKGEVGVRIQGKNYTIPEKRIKLHLKAEELYPDGDYDLDIVLTDWETRKNKKAVAKGKEGASVLIKEGE